MIMKINNALGALLGVTFLFGLSACGGGGGATDTGSSSSSGTSSSSSSTATYTVGGTVSGYASATALVLYDDGGDPLSITSNGAFTFGTALASGPYSVTIGTQPTGQICSVTNGSGVINTINVVNVAVNCTASTHNISGAVTGNAGTVTLLNNLGDAHSVTGNGGFTFTAQNYGTTYSVTVGIQPIGQTCLVSNGSGTIAGAVTNVTVSCVSIVPPLPPGPAVSFNYNPNQVILSWPSVADATYYTVSKDPTGSAGYSPICQANSPTATSCIDPFSKLTDFITASYIVSACNTWGCSSTSIAPFTKQAIQYLKASNTNPGDLFSSYSVALSADGSTLAVGAIGEASAAGAVYVFTRSGTSWSEQAYIMASNTSANDHFGTSVALSADGSTLVVGAFEESSSATGINGNQADNSALSSGAVYVFSRTGTSWSQQAYVKASNTNANDYFGTRVALSADGSTLSVGAANEASSAAGINGNQADNSASGAGAVYLFSRTGTSWSQQDYIKASNTDKGDGFGSGMALSADGSTLAVGASGEDSSATGINGNQSDNSSQNAGAVYVY